LWLTAAAVAVTFLTTWNRQQVFKATARILPSDAALYRPMLPDVNASGLQTAAPAAVRTQLPNLMSLVTSRTVAERTVQALDLDISPDDFQNRIEVSTLPNPASETRSDRSTDHVLISVYDSERERAVRSANMVAAVFANYYQEISHQEAVANTRFLETQLLTARQKLNEATDVLASFKSERSISALPEETTAAVTQLGQAKQQRDAALAAYAEARAKLNTVNAQMRSVSPTRVTVQGTTNTTMAQQLETQVATLTTQLNEARAKYYDGHPTVVNLQDALSRARSQLEAVRDKAQLIRNIASNPAYEALAQQKIQLQSEVDGYAARVAQLSAAVGRTASGLKPGTDVTLARLQQEFADEQATYSDLKARLADARLKERETTATGAIRLVDRATKAAGPIGRSPAFYVLLALALSLTVGMALALALETLDNRIRTDTDLERLLALPVTGLIPRMIGQPARALPRVTYVDPLSPISEAYKFIRTDLLLTAGEEPTNVVMIATAKPGQGGTTTAANLAISLAMDGKRVVLVDADMRRPQLHCIFKTPNDFGLSNVLAGERDLDEALLATEVENLYLLPAGPTPINPSELLGSARMISVINALRSSTDFVLFDTPSAVAFSDSIVLSRLVDGVLLVVRANQVARGAELQVRNLLNKANARIIGLVLNDVEPENVDSYYYHSHYYPNVRPSALALAGYAGGGLPALEDGDEAEELEQ